MDHNPTYQDQKTSDGKSTTVDESLYRFAHARGLPSSRTLFEVLSSLGLRWQILSRLWEFCSYLGLEMFAEGIYKSCNGKYTC